jgi:cysteine desulfurase / selenocysteine lyase
VLKQAAGTAQPRSQPKAQIDYPQPTAATPAKAAEELIEVFDFLGDDPNAKSLFVMDDLGAKLPNLFDLLKKVTTRVEGCMSEVYFVGRRSPKDAQVLEFVADADAAIVRGEIAMLEKLFSGQKASEILSFDIEAFFKRIGLDQFLTSQRRNGMAGMVRRIHLLAEQVAGAPDGT